MDLIESYTIGAEIEARRYSVEFYRDYEIVVTEYEWAVDECAVDFDPPEIEDDYAVVYGGVRTEGFSSIEEAKEYIDDEIALEERSKIFVEE